MINKKEKKLLSKVKFNVIQLRTDRMIPYELASTIVNLGDDVSEKELMFLQGLCEHYIRVKGYYKRYPQIEQRYNQEIVSTINDYRASN